MALQKTVQTPYGVEANYHKVALTNVDWYGKKAHVEILTFKDAEARQDDKLPIGSFAIDVDTEAFDFSPDDNIIIKVYEKIKAMPEFSDAIDC